MNICGRASLHCALQTPYNIPSTAASITFSFSLLRRYTKALRTSLTRHKEARGSSSSDNIKGRKTAYFAYAAKRGMDGGNERESLKKKGFPETNCPVVSMGLT